MRILFCVPAPITSKLGKPKVYIELAEALEKEGCACTIVGRNDVAPKIGDLPKEKQEPYYQDSLRKYINAQADAYDVIEYEHPHLPFPRSVLPNNVVLVSRSVLLAHHARDIRWPVWQGILPLLRNAAGYVQSGSPEEINLSDYAYALKKHVGTALRYERGTAHRRKRVQQAQVGMQAADLVAVSNRHDVRALMQSGFAEEKILRLPFGLSEERKKELAEAQSGGATNPVITFVGTFDFRKGGAIDIPQIAKAVLSRHPQARFRLLGTSGLFVDEKQALVHFPISMHSQIEVVPRYEPGNLPALLSGSTLGIFPSQYEGFPFGVLEMLAAGLPVIAYDAPGPPEMVPEEWLVPRGGWEEMVRKATSLLTSSERLAICQDEARSRAHTFRWDKVAKSTYEAYKQKAK